MTRFRRLLCACAIVSGVCAIGASAASAATFYVNERNGSDAFACVTQAKPCLTIAGGVKRSEEAGGANTVEVAEGDYTGTINLDKPADKGLTINGEEAGVKFTGTVSVALSGTITLSNMWIVHQTGASAAIADDGAQLTLENMLVDDESGTNGIEAEGSGSVTIDGGTLEMENGASGYTVSAESVPLTLSGVTILNGSESQAEAGGVNSEKSTLAVTNTKVAIESGLGIVHFGVATGSDTSVLLNDVSVRQGTAGAGVVLEKSPATVAGLQVEMLDSASTAPGVLDESETPGISSSLAHVEVSGAWKGTGLLITGEQATLSDSRVLRSSSSAAPALRYAGGESSTGLVVQSSVLQAPPAAKPAAVEVKDSNATFDSSEVFGGAAGISSENTQGGARTLTVAGSTIGPNPGISFETPGIVGVEATTSGNKSSTVQTTIEGSIVLESQVATATKAGNTTRVTCAYSAIPSQIQSADSIAGHGEISCASGASANTNESSEYATLFAEPLHNYNLSPTSSAVDSVPASAIALPFGLTPSATDLTGNPRVVDGNGDCVAVQDKGALELQGHSNPCPTAGTSTATSTTTTSTTTTTTKSSLPTLVGTITALKLSPSSFLPAPSGATIAKAKSKAKKKQKFGTTISYIDSQAATTTFTVVSEAKGRRQGKTCKRPSKANKRGKPCKLLVKKGSFTHMDASGANSLRFSGRLGGRALAKGAYTLQAVPSDAAGSGAPVSKPFTIK